MEDNIMLKHLTKGFVLADSIIGLLIVSLGMTTFAIMQDQLSQQENEAKKQVALNRKALNQSYQVLEDAKQTDYHFEKIVVKQDDKTLEITLEK